MRKVIIGLLAILIIIPATGLAKKKPKDLMGIYSVTGYNPGVQTSGTPSYVGELSISQSGGAYILDWSIGTKKKEKYNGVGIYTNGILSVGFNGGVVSYKVEGNTLKGVWAPFNGGVFGYEFCEKKR